MKSKVWFLKKEKLEGLILAQIYRTQQDRDHAHTKGKWQGVLPPLLSFSRTAPLNNQAKTVYVPERMCAPTSAPFSTTHTLSSVPLALASCLRRMAAARPCVEEGKGRKGRRMTWLESKGAPHNQSYRAWRIHRSPRLMHRHEALSYAILPPPAQVYLPLARRPQ